MINTQIIESYRLSNNLSKAQFCSACKISPSTYDKILTNNAHLKLRPIVKIAKVINVELKDLFVKKDNI